MDAKDRKIIDVLLMNADMSTREISKKTGLPITTVHNRTVKLKRDGIIKNYTITIDHEAIGEGFSAYILIKANIETLKEKGRTQRDIINDLKKLPEIKNASIVSGGTDIITHIRTKNVSSFDTLLLERIQRIQGISNTQSLIVIR